MILEASGYQSTIVTSLQEAKNLLVGSSPYKCVISDMRMAGNPEAGLAVLRAANQVGIPTIIVTGFADMATVKTALNEGARYFLEKPVPFDELKSAISKLYKDSASFGSLLESFFSRNDLTAKEVEVARLLLKGLPNKEIADVTQTSENTVKVHVAAIFRKCHVKSRAELFSEIFPT